MIGHRKPHTDHVECLLTQAHRGRQEVTVGEDWDRGIMQAVREDAAAHPYSSMLAWAEPLVWRAAAGAALMAVVFAGSVVAYTARQPQPATAAWLEEFDAAPPLIEE